MLVHHVGFSPVVQPLGPMKCFFALASSASAAAVVQPVLALAAALALDRPRIPGKWRAGPGIQGRPARRAQCHSAGDHRGHRGPRCPRKARVPETT